MTGLEYGVKIILLILEAPDFHIVYKCLHLQECLDLSPR